MLSNEERAKLKEIAKDLRLDIIDTMGYAGGAHVGGSMSMMDIMTVLYFKYLKVDPKNPNGKIEIDLSCQKVTAH